MQGIGFVGAAMLSVLADARNKKNEAYYNLIGVDLDTKIGKERVESINLGLFHLKPRIKK